MDAPSSNLTIVRALMSVIDACDPFTRGHSFRTSKFVVRLARHLDVPADEWEQIEFGALLHDIGRTAILHDVLLRPGKLDTRERAVLHTHPSIGYEIVRDLPGLEQAAEIVFAHHERPDGNGYPRGLRGEEIPMGARLIMVAAAFDAMTEDRPYRKGLGVEQAYAELRRHSGTQFFPDVVDAFIELHQTGALFSEFSPEEFEIYARSRPLVQA